MRQYTFVTFREKEFLQKIIDRVNGLEIVKIPPCHSRGIAEK